MSRELLQQALDALKHHRQQTTFQFCETNAAIQALEKELAKPEQSSYSDIVSDGGLDPRNKFDAQPEQEPIAHLWECIGRWSAYLAANGKQGNLAPPTWLVDAVKAATAPPRKEWVGLTDDEVAWAEGKTIQNFNDRRNCWEDLTGDPYWVNSFQYRIKPESKPDAVRYITIEATSSCGQEFVQVFVSGKYISPNLRLTFSGETGQLKSAEVLK
jgi:hypothetical protein